MNYFINIYKYRELIFILAWKNISVRYKQAYLGIAWAVIKPFILMLLFTLVKSFVGIDSGWIPYPIFVFAALMPWVFFQEAASEGINSVVANAALIRKIYFPREVFPLTIMLTKLLELAINFIILALLMWYFEMEPSRTIIWVPLLIFYTMLVTLTISLFGSAVNVYYRDIAAALPMVLSVAMYISPVIYPLSLVKDKLLIQQGAGEWSNTLYFIYTLNPIAGIIDAFQGALFSNMNPDLDTLAPGLVLTLIALPLSYLYFKHAETHFADMI